MRSTIRSSLGALPLTLGLLFAASAQAADISEITKDDYHGYAYYQSALEHPKVAKQKSEKKKLKMIAKDLGWRGKKGRKKLKAAIEKVESLGGEADSLAQSLIEAELGKTRVKGRVLKVTVDARTSDHVVAYIRWRGSKRKEAVKEASEIAHTIAEKVPMVSTISLGAIHPKSPDDAKKLVWSAKIAADAAVNISPRRIDGYADRLYKRLFEEVTELPY